MKLIAILFLFQSSVPQVSQQPSRKAKNKKKDDNNIEPSTSSTASTSGTNNGNSSKQEDLKPTDNTVETAKAIEESKDEVISETATDGKTKKVPKEKPEKKAAAQKIR